jgi:hypothetical protein
MIDVRSAEPDAFFQRYGALTGGKAQRLMNRLVLNGERGRTLNQRSKQQNQQNQRV